MALIAHIRASFATLKVNVWFLGALKCYLIVPMSSGDTEGRWNIKAKKLHFA